jgi:hypothetical protein
MARTYFTLFLFFFVGSSFRPSQFTLSVFTLTGSATGSAPDVRAASLIASVDNLLRMSAAPLEHLMLLNGYSRARLFELAKFKVSGKSVRTRQTSVLISWAPFLNARRRSYARELDITSGKPMCTETLQQVLIELLWHTVLSRNTANEAKLRSHFFAQFQLIIFLRKIFSIKK